MSFKHFVEQNLPKYANVVIYAVLEWVMILLIFVDGFLALLSDEFARFFELNIPCLLCTRIDCVLSRCRRSWSSSSASYDDSLCESHKREISSLGYCNAHKKISNIGRMCENCIGSHGKEKREDTSKEVEMTSCSCCGEFIKKRLVATGNNKCYRRNGSMNGPTPSPRVRRQHEQHLQQRSVDSPRMRFKDLKMISDSDEDYLSNIAREVIEDCNNKKSSSSEGTLVPQEEACRTPNFMRGNLNNRFYGIPLTDSAHASPRLSRLSIENILSDLNSNDESSSSSTTTAAGDQGGDIVGQLKRQVRLDHKSLAALYAELEEERNAAGIAANNAMAMITRLQDEKAALQMEALQYQRMMEEEVEFDQEEVELMKEMLGRREEEMKALEDELDAYRLKYGPLLSDEEDDDDDDDYQELRSNLLPSSFNVSECVSPRDDDERNSTYH
ncbi:unnamed protein product [Cuscuta campestris]|uniref:GTD-binding domain-containing protein n=1 Tax=Cuscuta campestris TaxID=132261 RepID=A0A484MCW6_9ASTE|nr:unnamed protein product [Cuscuta campestris]